MSIDDTDDNTDSNSESSDTADETNDYDEEEFVPLDTDDEHFQNHCTTPSVNRENEAPPGASKYPIAWKLQQDTASHGETHVIIEGHDAELELRRNTTTFDYNDGLIRVSDAGLIHHMIPFDRIVRWYKPKSVWDN